MIPRCYPQNSAGQIPVLEVSPTGLQAWVDYIVCGSVEEVAASANTYNNDGYVEVEVLDSGAGLVAWIDYVPVVIDVDPSGPRWSTSGFIPVFTGEEEVPTQATVRAVGTASSGAASCTPTIPVGAVAGDILYAPVTITRRSTWEVTCDIEGWELVDTAQAAGTVDGTTGIMFGVYWKRHDGSETDPTFTVATSDFIISQIVAVQDAIESGTPHEDVQGHAASASTTALFDATTALGELRLLLHFAGNSRDATSSSSYTVDTWLLADGGAGTAMSEIMDQSTATGGGGSVGAAYFEAYDTTNDGLGGQVTTATSSVYATFAVVVIPGVE